MRRIRELWTVYGRAGGLERDILRLQMRFGFGAISCVGWSGRVATNSGLPLDLAPATVTVGAQTVIAAILELFKPSFSLALASPPTSRVTCAPVPRSRAGSRRCNDAC